MLPEMELRFEMQMTNPPKPAGFIVYQAGVAVGVVSAEKAKEVSQEYAALVEAWEKR